MDSTILAESSPSVQAILIPDTLVWAAIAILSTKSASQSDLLVANLDQLIIHLLAVHANSLLAV